MSEFQAKILDQFVEGCVSRFPDDFVQLFKMQQDEEKKKSVALSVLAVTKELGLSEEDAYDCIVEGGNDLFIDAIFYEEKNDDTILITIFQSKYKQKLHGKYEFSENAIIQMRHTISTITDPDFKINLNKRLAIKIEEIRSLIRNSKIPTFEIILCNNGQKWTDNAQAIIDNISNDFDGQVEWKHMGVEEFTTADAKDSVKADFTLSGKAIVHDFDYKRALIGKINVVTLAQLMNTHGDSLLQKNVRHYLKNTKINREIMNTLKDKKMRNDFYFYNNGITFVCTNMNYPATLKENWYVKLENTHIINGGQTAKAAQEVMKDLEGEDLESVDVLIRVYELPENDEDFINNIAYATNNQNPVDLRDLKSNDDKQKNLEQYIADLPEIDGIKFEYRAKRPWNNVPNEITSAVAAEAILAIWRQRPHEARFRTRQHFGTLYDIIFTDDLNASQTIIATLIHRYTENIRKRLPNDEDPRLAYGSRFIAMQIGRYLLQDLEIGIENLDHRNVKEAYKTLKERQDKYYILAARDVQNIVSTDDKTLQQLSAFFRSPSSVKKILNNELQQNLL